MLEIKDLNLIYEDNYHVLKDINFKVEDGEIVGIIGLSGAGKTSLLRTLNLLQVPTSGKILLDGVDLTSLDKEELRKIRKKISIVFQHFNLLSSRTVFQNVALPLEIEDLSKKEIEEKVNKMLESMNLIPRKDAYPSQLSGGEKQRTAIARALISNPDIILFDEPTSSLDPKTTQKILDLILEINQSTRKSILIVTHEMDVIKKICDKVVYLKNGYVNFVGPVHEFFIEKETELNNEFYQEINIDWSKTWEMVRNKNQKLLKIVFWGSKTHEPVLYDVAKKYDVSVNILYGKIEHLKDSPYGTMIIAINSDNSHVENFLKELSENVYKVEVLN
ncbi:MAG: methionine ABC transporter ATP-binding protein [Defluviitoga tunisiensis]|uniref:Methionine import ATP-binding protein MetN n=1 Tax=Defluviitoga tunisiensis TaxID=1006576 RepID=A0A0C7NJN8_DEFTU|nr:methionine ABC transporter ATP-binding protein [Defluviitoga tunisiensis]MDD3601265.1 methionine ABC transporter ATP-binding protein [Defluviitoga tunisiensis]MDY0379667.1 methionine ABC transporter ATP-binding protein [Defluviitoga tunisiensis]CEP78171.1 Methionine import ATP-binding protein MetN [Defluviitoga tunisiensis]HOB55965.1 methionine ABC transporter ATP-binding protein [Defluviitoga tunisiensis]HOK16754.1 methionine ABC transporter ATP-binding protein [Defluviitoga tunisiensis]